MNNSEQTKAFASDLDALVSRYANEFDMTYASVIGTLFMKAQLLCGEAKEGEEPERDYLDR